MRERDLSAVPTLLCAFSGCRTSSVAAAFALGPSGVSAGVASNSVPNFHCSGWVA
jgi:hypothetical protein